MYWAEKAAHKGDGGFVDGGLCEARVQPEMDFCPMIKHSKKAHKGDDGLVDGGLREAWVQPGGRREVQHLPHFRRPQPGADCRRQPVDDDQQVVGLCDAPVPVAVPAG